MPFDRRRPRTLMAWILSPLPWAWQDRIPSPATDRLLYMVVVLWLLGPWPFAVALVGWGVWRLYLDGRKVRERGIWFARDVRTDRAVWMVRIAEDWRWNLLRRFGLLWLPAKAPLAGGDVILFDIRGEGEAEGALSIQFPIAGRLANPATTAPRRHRRLVRLQAFWTLETPLPLSALPETARAVVARSTGRPYPVQSVEPIDEQNASLTSRLEAKDSIREPRKPTWRHERRAHQLFHQLWSSWGSPYDKRRWCELQSELNRAGVLV